MSRSLANQRSTTGDLPVRARNTHRLNGRMAVALVGGRWSASTGTDRCTKAREVMCSGVPSERTEGIDHPYTNVGFAPDAPLYAGLVNDFDRWCFVQSADPAHIGER